jgi:hypothetical protein
VTEELSRIYGRIYRVEIDGVEVAVATPDHTHDGLRCGFTVERTLAKEPNTAEVSIYNLAAETRGQFAKLEGVLVVIEAGYVDTGLTTIFKGEMREGFSRPEGDQSWITIVRAGDGDTAHSKSRSNRGFRPGVSLEQAINQMAKDMKVGVGNVAKEILSGKVDGIGDVFGKGMTTAGSTMEQLQRQMRSIGKEVSIQDGELQVVDMGSVVGMPATVLMAGTGLEGTPEIDGKGIMSCRARILPGLVPGYPIEIVSEVIGVGLWRIDKVRYVGDTHGNEWAAEIEAREIVDRPPEAKAAPKPKPAEASP